MKSQGGGGTRAVALASLFAAAYAAAVVILAPISFQLFQVRIADIMLPLSILFGWPAVLGLALGNAVANLLSSPFGAIDVVGGSAANFIATFLAWKVGGRGFRGSWLAAITVETLAVTFIVGGYLSVILGVPLWLSWVGVLIGSVISINIGGYLLLKGVCKALAKA